MPEQIAQGLGFIALTWGTWVFCAGVFASWKRFLLGRSRHESVEIPEILFIRPCAGHEPRLERCLISVLHANGFEKATHVFATNSEHDAAVPTIDKVCERLREAGRDAHRIVLAPNAPNRKVTLLDGMAREGNQSVVVSCDSNVDLTGFDLHSLVGPLLRDDTVGAAWVPHVEEPSSGLGGRTSLAVTSGSLTAFGLLCGMHPSGLVGKLFALKRSALERVGGFRSLSRYLAEDLQLSATLRGAGFKVVAIPAVIKAVRGPESYGQAVARVARWMTASRAHRLSWFLSYPVFFFATPFLLAASIPAWFFDPALAGAATGVAILGRLQVALAAQHYSGKRAGLVRALTDSVLSDLTMALGWFRAARSNRVEWRGRALRINSDGHLESV